MNYMTEFMSMCTTQYNTKCSACVMASVLSLIYASIHKSESLFENGSNGQNVFFLNCQQLLIFFVKALDN